MPETSNVHRGALADTSRSAASSWAWTLVRWFIGFGWLRAAAEKLLDVQWWTGEALGAYLAGQSGMVVEFFDPFLTHVVEPLIQPTAWFVALTQLAIGIALVAGRALRPALAIGIGLNMSFVLAGTVSPSAFYLVLQTALLFAIADSRAQSRDTAPSVEVAMALAGTALILVPFVMTIDPAEAVHDPALVLAFLAGLSSAVQTLRWAAHSGLLPGGSDRRWLNPI